MHAHASATHDTQLSALKQRYEEELLLAHHDADAKIRVLEQRLQAEIQTADQTCARCKCWRSCFIVHVTCMARWILTHRHISYVLT